MKHLEILAYAMNVLKFREASYSGCALYTTEDALKDQKGCGFVELLDLKLIEDLTVGNVLTALESIIANHYGKAYTPNQFTEARKDLLELVGCRDQQTLREVVCPDR